MAQAGDVLELPNLGMKIVFRQTSAETDGALLEYDVIGRPRGFVVQGHVHPGAGGAPGGRRRRERPRARQEQARLRRRRVVRRPARHAAPPLPRRLGRGPRPRRAAARAADGGSSSSASRELDRDGQITSRGWLKPTAAARIVLRLRARRAARRDRRSAVQRALAGAVLGLGSIGENATGEYVFVDEWDVRAPKEVVFDALADGRTYPEWWKPVYIAVGADGPPKVGAVSRQEFKGKLPYHLQTTSTIVEYEPPDRVVADVDGRPARPRRLDADRRGPRASRTSASTGRCSPTASCCARSRRCCGRSSARTTTGRSPARWRASSPTPSARTPVVDTNWPR